MSQIVLASASPRRKELLEQIGVEFEICPAKGEEVITTTIPKDVVLELSKQKAEEVAAMLSTYKEEHAEITTAQDMCIIGSDTVVAYGDEILGKPKDDEDAKRMLRMLQGNVHAVYTGVTVVVINKKGQAGEFSFYEKTEVEFYPMTEAQIADYVASGDPQDKAGSYGIQGACAAYIKGIHGDYNNVVGLPVGRLYQECQKVGIDLRRFPEEK